MIYNRFLVCDSIIFYFKILSNFLGSLQNLVTLKTEQPPPEIIQDLRTVCHDMSSPTEELPHSGSLKIHGQNEHGNGPVLRTPLLQLF